MGELTFPEPVIAKAVKAVYDLGVPLNLHANGDGAIDTFLRVHETIAADDLARDRNVTMIHAQFAREDQLDKFAQYKIRPSLYTLHTYYFVEAHITNRGTERAMYISPMRDAMDKGLEPTSASPRLKDCKPRPSTLPGYMASRPPRAPWSRASGRIS